MSQTKRTLDSDATASNGSGGWVKCYSKTYQREYWFNEVDGSRSWNEPEHQSQHKKVKMQDTDGSSTGPAVERPLDMRKKVAIIVPFRDISKDKTRTRQLDRFVPTMVAYLKATDTNFHIYIVNQSDDGRKFNRGKLLNIGFDLAVKEGCTSFIFHDVDLLPSEELKPYYVEEPAADHPVHIARVWNRYNANPNYFGGVVAFSKDMYERINGFPNNFWGWGGEDDEMYKRVVKAQLKPVAPSSGSLTDMEDMNLDAKLAYLRTNKLLKCMNKHELLQEHEKTWRTNGLKDLSYEVLGRESLHPSGCASKVTVDVQLNKHWTDSRCGISDTQL